MTDPMRRPPKPQPGFFRRVFTGNFISILVLLALVLVMVFLFRGRKKEFPAPPVPPPDQEVSAPAESAPQETPPPALPEGARESTLQEKMNTKEEPPTPEYVKEHVAKLKHSLETGVQGARMSLPYETDPRKIAEMKSRIEMAERVIRKLDAVNPDDRSTWFFLNEKTPVKGRDVPRASNPN